MMSTELDTLINDADVIISEMASEAKQLKSDLDGGHLSQSEYDELMGDLLDLSMIDELANNIERKANVEKAAKLIATIIGTVL